MVFAWLADRRRKKILQKEFPAAWTAIIEKNVGAYHLLDTDEQERLRQLVQVFLAEKNFEGCGGLELTDEMRVTIAGTGCLMLLGRDHDLFSEVESILVYPSTIVARDLGRSVFDTSGRVVEEGKTVLGQAVKGGAVILAWDSALQGAKDARDGHNVVIHELAHKIDFIDGSADGTPEFETYAERRAWSAALEPAYLAHKTRAAKGKTSFLDDYAITNEAEYFAVASEAFFEQPRAFAKQLPDVYKSLAAFYKLDLAARAPEDAKTSAKAKGKPNASKPADKAKRKAPARKSSPVIAAAPPPTFRKTAAMAVVALPADLEAAAAPAPKKADPKTNAPTRKSAPVSKSSAAIVVPPTDGKPARSKSSAVIAVPQAAIDKATRGKSSAAIVVPPTDGKPARSRSSAAIAVPQAAVDKATRGRSSAAIALPPVEKTPRGKSSAAIALPPVEKSARGKSSAAILVPPVDEKPASRGKSR
jgi:Mlc titration factor MtfA (ptsG expression regulator)